ncbi:MAG: LysR family transcriptional regulator [Pseudomonadota bacterium]
MHCDLNLTQLKAFYFAATHGSFTLAAEKLFITQPAVSMQVKALEACYGVQLFVRRKKELQLTDVGDDLFQIAKRIFGMVREAENLLELAGEPKTEVLKIGSTKTLVRYVLAKYISTFQKSYPLVQIQIDDGSSREMVQSVLRNENDLAIVGRVTYDDSLQVIPFFEDELVLMAAPSHPLCKKAVVSIEDLKGESLILREKGSGTRELVERVLEKTSIVSSAIIESGNADFIKELVRIGDGITLLAEMGADEHVNRGDLRILPLKEGSFRLKIDIVYSKDRELSAIDEAFLKVLLEDHREMETLEEPVGGVISVEESGSALGI